MIKPSKYNGINFSYDINRESHFFDVNVQREINLISQTTGLLSFFYETNASTAPTAILDCTELFFEQKTPVHTLTVQGGFIFFFECPVLLYSEPVVFSLKIENDVIYSEFCKYIKGNISKENVLHILASNNDNRHGYLSDPAFGFFYFSELNVDVFANKSTIYEYSYSRKKILSSENQTTKKITFLNLSMYQQNLLKWLCNCENLYINDVKYQLISEFSEVGKSDGLETCDLQATFVEVNQSFFTKPATKQPKAIKPNNLFN